MTPPRSFTVLRTVTLLALPAALAGVSRADTPQDHADALYAKGYLSREQADRLKGPEDTSAEVQLLQSRLEVAKKTLARSKDLVRTGQATQADQDNAEADVRQLEIQLNQAAREDTARRDRARLLQPVSIQMDHASVQQFATALSKATGIPVEVDKSIPSDASTMLTIDAQQVPLASVLEAIGQKIDLMIAPQGSGVVFRKWPHLNDRIYRSPNAPWSPEWGVPPTLGAELMGPGGDLFGRGGFNPNPGGAGNAQQAFGFGASGGFQTGPGNPGLGAGGIRGDGLNPGANPGAMRGGLGGDGRNLGANPRAGFGGGFGAKRPVAGVPGSGGFGPGGGEKQPGMNNLSAPMAGMMPGPGPGMNGPEAGLGFMPGVGPVGTPPFSMTNLGDHLIAIAEPGRNAQGEPGVWLTAYRFDGAQFKKVSATFHRLSGMEPRPAPGSKPAMKR